LYKVSEATKLLQAFRGVWSEKKSGPNQFHCDMNCDHAEKYSDALESLERIKKLSITMKQVSSLLNTVMRLFKNVIFS